MKVLNKYAKRLVPVGLVFALIAGQSTVASASTFTNISLEQDNPAAGADGVEHTFTLSNATVTPISCITVRYSMNADGTGGVPGGFDSDGASVDTGASSLLADWSGWTVDVTPTNGLVEIQGGPDPADDDPARTLVLDGIDNGTVGKYYVTVKTYSDACTTVVDQGVIAGEWEDTTEVYVAVDPTLTFEVTNSNAACNGQNVTNATAGGDATSLNMGRVNSGNTAGAAQTFAVTTNAANGWTVTVETTQAANALRFGSIEIADVAADTDITSAGSVEAFGFTSKKEAVDTYEPLELTPKVVADQGTGTPCIGFQVSVADGTAAGRYAAIAIYTAVPVF